MDREMWHRLECPCNPAFRYKNYDTFVHHFVSNRHTLFESQKQRKELRINSGLLETSNTRLRHEKSVLEISNARLRNEKSVLETSNARLGNEKSVLETSNTRLGNEKSVLETSNTRLRNEKSILETEWNRLNDEVGSLRAALDELRARVRLSAGRFIACWMRSRILEGRLQDRHKLCYDQCLRHLTHFHEYNNAIRACHGLLRDIS